MVFWKSGRMSGRSWRSVTRIFSRSQLLALLLSVASADRLSPRRLATSQCAAESKCISSSCSEAFAHTDFPVSAWGVWSESLTNSTLSLMACTTACSASSATCSPLQSLSIRLKDGLLAKPSKFEASPEGASVSNCSDAGKGYRWTGVALGPLGVANPSKVRSYAHAEGEWGCRDRLSAM